MIRRRDFVAHGLQQPAADAAAPAAAQRSPAA
jgi:hypothetical protein